MVATVAARTRAPAEPLRARREPALLLAALLWATAIIHGEAAAGHWHEWPLAAAFFIGLAAAQFAAGAALWARPSRLLLLTAATASLLVAGLWVVTRTVGVPLSPDGTAPETVGVLDVAATLGEVAFAGLALSALRRGEGALPPRAVLQATLVGLLFGAMAAGAHVH